MDHSHTCLSVRDLPSLCHCLCICVPSLFLNSLHYKNMYGYRGLWSLRAVILIIFRVSQTDRQTSSNSTYRISPSSRTGRVKSIFLIEYNAFKNKSWPSVCNCIPRWRWRAKDCWKPTGCFLEDEINQLESLWNWCQINEKIMLVKKYKVWWSNYGTEHFLPKAGQVAA